MAGALAAQLSSMSLSGPTSLKTFRASPLASFSHPCHARQQVFRSRVPLKVVAARVGGVEIPNNKHVEYSLRYIYGIGPTTAKALVAEVPSVQGKRIRELTEGELTQLRDEVEKYTTEGDLRRFNSLNIRRLKEIQCYRGKRHIMGLPVRGQKTKTNARTRKGKTKTVAGKKK
jgi:small subunit ribosomal protein S13